MKSEILIATAIDHFGKLGFEGASTRDIAKESGTAMSSITYHFGGKEGLYLAVADHIADRIRDIQGTFIDTLRVQMPASPAAAIATVQAILERFAMMMVMPETEAWARFIMREQSNPTEAFERIYKGVMGNLIGLLLDLIAIARPDLPDARRRAMAVHLFSQTMVLRVARASVGRIMQDETLSGEALQTLLTSQRANVAAMLGQQDNAA